MHGGAMSKSRIVAVSFLVVMCTAASSYSQQLAETVVRLAEGAAQGAANALNATGSSKQTKMEGIETRVTAMQAAIKTAVSQFEKANSDAKDRVARLDKVVATIDNSIAELADDGPLFREIEASIKTTEEQKSRYKDKAFDPSVDARNRERYRVLMARLDKNVSDLVEKRMILRDQRTELSKQRDSLAQDKDFILDLMTADEISAANEALGEVIASVQAVVKSIDEFAANIGSDDEQKADKQMR